VYAVYSYKTSSIEHYILYNLPAVVISVVYAMYDTTTVTCIQGVCVSTATQPSGDEAAVYHEVYGSILLLILSIVYYYQDCTAVVMLSSHVNIQTAQHSLMCSADRSSTAAVLHACVLYSHGMWILSSREFVYMIHENQIQNYHTTYQPCCCDYALFLLL
jgi:hypothetical protein